MPSQRAYSLDAQPAACCKPSAYAGICNHHAAAGVLLLLLLSQIFPTLQEPLHNMRENRARFASMEQSCLDMAGMAGPTLGPVGSPPRTPAAASNRSSDSAGAADTAAEAAAAAAAQLEQASLDS